MDLSNYVIKADLKGITGVHTSNLAAKSDLTRLKAEVDKIDQDKLKTAPADLSKPKNVVDNDICKMTMYDKLQPRSQRIFLPQDESEKRGPEALD